MEGSRLRCQLRDAPELRIEERAPDHEQGDGLRARRRSQRPLNLVGISNLEWQQCPPPCEGGGFSLPPHGEAFLVSENRDRSNGGDYPQQLELLSDQLG